MASVAIDAASPKNVKTDNCTVSGLTSGKNEIAFNYLANSLPYPVDTIPSGFGKPARSQAVGLRLVPFIDEFNEELLQVKGLQPLKKYQLKIDNKIIGTWEAADFEKGINLALVTNTPQYQQATAIMQLNEERWEKERRLREYYWMHFSILKPHGLLFNDSEATLDSLQKYAKKDFFVAVTMPSYQKARFQIVREAWKKEIALLTDEIYAANKPLNRRVEITLIN